MEQTEIDGHVLSKYVLKFGSIAFKFGHFQLYRAGLNFKQLQIDGRKPPLTFPPLFEHFKKIC